MVTIIRRPGENGQTSYRAQLRCKGTPPLSATFTKLADAKKWGQTTAAAILEDRHPLLYRLPHHGTPIARRAVCRFSRISGCQLVYDALHRQSTLWSP